MNEEEKLELQSLDLIYMLKNNSIKSLARSLNVSYHVMLKNLTKQFQLKNIGDKENSEGAWMNSMERQSFINFKNSKQL